MKQNSLFGNLPKMNDKMKELNKEIIKKTKTPKKSKTAVVRVDGQATTALAKKVSLLIETLKQRLVDNEEFELITDEKRFRSYMQMLRTKKHLYPALDTETTGLDPINNHVVGFGFYVPDSKAVYVPMRHTDLMGNILEEQISEEVIKEELEKCIKEDVHFVYHNATFDMRMVRNTLNMKRYLQCHWDTQVAANYLNENESHQLKPLWDKYVSRSENTSDTFNKLFDGVPFNYIPPNLGYQYAAKDPKITHELFKFQEQYLNPDSKQCKSQGLVNAGQFFYTIEMPLTYYLCEMMDEGVTIDEKRAEELSEKYNKMLIETQNKFNKYVSKYDFSTLPAELRGKLSNPININSPQQLAIIIYDYLKLSSVDRKSPRGTGEDVILKLIERNEEHKELFNIILEFRGIAKLLGTYIDKLPKIVKTKTGRLHGNYNPFGAKTGRFSSSDPNLQNIPSRNKEIRKMFRAEDDWTFIGGDFSQQEPRVLAHLAFTLFDERKMLDAYLSGLDLYSWMASEVYKVPYEECLEFASDGSKNPPEYKKRRSSVKEIVLGLMYGRSTKSVAEKLGISEQEAQEIVDMLFDSFPAIKMVDTYYKEMVKEDGYVQTVYGRKRRLPDYNLPKYEFVDIKDRSRVIEDIAIRRYFTDKMNNAWGFKQKAEVKKEANAQGIWIVENDMKISEAERQILNSVIQGTGADITKKAMVLLGQNEELRELGFKLVLQVHDEIIGKAPKENALKCAEIMNRIMLESVADDIITPMSVDCEIFEYWNGPDITEELKAS